MLLYFSGSQPSSQDPQRNTKCFMDEIYMKYFQFFDLSQITDLSINQHDNDIFHCSA